MRIFCILMALAGILLMSASGNAAKAQQASFDMLGQKPHSFNHKLKKGPHATSPSWSGSYPDVRYRRPFMRPQTFTMLPEFYGDVVHHKHAHKYYKGTLAPRHIPSHERPTTDLYKKKMKKSRSRALSSFR